MTSRKGPSHVVVDGSNIATEGRSLPSLAQLSEAVESFMEEYPDAAITVVVDATFGHRIDKKEVAEFEAGISNNELVAPPAGAIGRGDAFVLSIAQKAKASILSNDSFQEFHADYDWLFDEGRLIGGKPVPHVGWVFVNRSPVRGPISRKATQGARSGSRTRGGSRRGDADRGPVAVGSGSPLANEPMPVPKTPPPGRSKRSGNGKPVDVPVSSPPAPRAGDVVNELMPFLEFVEHHPIGTSVNGIVETYSSHGAYIMIGTDGVRGYIPLRLMSDPPPTSARKVMQIGEAVTVVVVSFAAARRSIDCALPDMAGYAQATPVAAEDVQTRSPRRGRSRTETRVAEAVIEQLGGEPVDVPVTASEPTTERAKRGSRKRAASPSNTAVAAVEDRGESDVVTEARVVKTAASTKTPVAKTTAKKAPAKKAPAKKAPAKKAPARRAPVEKASAKTSVGASATLTTPGSADTAVAKKSPAKKATAVVKAADNQAATKTRAKSAAKRPPAKRAAPAAKKAGAKKVAPGAGA
jgi:hypothetical protein